MKFENFQKLPEGQFRRLTGVKPKTFQRIVEIVKEADEGKRAKGGRPKKLCVEDRILMTLEYLREYRTYAHIGVSYGLSESNTFANIREIENILIKCEDFKLPGRKALLQTDHEFEIVLVDVSESPMQRPKKNNASSIPVRKNGIP